MTLLKNTHLSSTVLIPAHIF